MSECRKSYGSVQICDLGVTGCTVYHNGVGRRRTDRVSPPTSNAARLQTLEPHAYDGGTRRNRVDFLTFQVPNLLHGVAELIRFEEAYHASKEARANPMTMTLVSYRELLAALECRDQASALSRIEALKAGAANNSQPEFVK